MKTEHVEETNEIRTNMYYMAIYDAVSLYLSKLATKVKNNLKDYPHLSVSLSTPFSVISDEGLKLLTEAEKRGMSYELSEEMLSFLFQELKVFDYLYDKCTESTDYVQVIRNTTLLLKSDVEKYCENDISPEGIYEVLDHILKLLDEDWVKNSKVVFSMLYLAHQVGCQNYPRLCAHYLGLED